MPFRHVHAYRAVVVLFGLALLTGAAACSSHLPGQTQGLDGPAPSSNPTDSPVPSDSPSATPGATPTPINASTAPGGPASGQTTTRPGAQAPAQPLIPGKPGPGNTGIPAGAALTVVNGTQTFSTPGVISNMDFHGFVKVIGQNITFRNCIFRGAATSSNAGLLDTERGTNIVVEDSEFVPSAPSATIDDIWASNLSIYRSNIHGGVDGVKTGSNVLIQDSYIHDMTWFASDPNQGGGPTHNDGVQSFYGDSNVTIRHNTIDMSTTKDANAAFQDSATPAVVDSNWLDGGGCTLNFAHHDNKQLTGIYVTNNRFGRHSFFSCPILVSTLTVLSANTNNVWDDTGTPIPPVQRHD